MDHTGKENELSKIECFYFQEMVQKERDSISKKRRKYIICRVGHNYVRSTKLDELSQIIIYAILLYASNVSAA